MTATRALSPIEQLQQMELRSKRNANQLPQQIEIKQTWDGVAFRLGSYRLVAPMEQVKEILTYPSLTRVPGSKGWVKGIANVRGNLLPILDLQGFIAGEPSALKKESRILVVQHYGVSAGLLVDELQGMRHFLEEEKSKDKGQLDERIQEFLTGSFRQGNNQWWVIDLHRLTEDPMFLQVAA